MGSRQGCTKISLTSCRMYLTFTFCLSPFCVFHLPKSKHMLRFSWELFPQPVRRTNCTQKTIKITPWQRMPIKKMHSTIPEAKATQVLYRMRKRWKTNKNKSWPTTSASRGSLHHWSALCASAPMHAQV